MKIDTRNVKVVAPSASHFAFRCAASSSPRRNTARINAAIKGVKVTMERRLSMAQFPVAIVTQVIRTTIPITIAKA